MGATFPRRDRGNRRSKDNARPRGYIPDLKVAFDGWVSEVYESMSRTVFFSWQSDTPTLVGRNFIERALERAAARIGADTEIELADRDLVVDRDTKRVSGSPPIVETIFQKIDNAAVFVPDLTFVGKRADRELAPNSNVLIEYGWALKSRDYGRIVSVMNTAFGLPSAETLPFNLRHFRYPISYDCPPDADEATRKQVREALAKDLEQALRDVLVRDDLLSGSSRPGFAPMEPKNGQGRFRSLGEPLGVSDGFYRRPSSEVSLVDSPVIWLRVMPAVDPGRAWLVTDLKKRATTPTIMIEPLAYSAGGFHYVRSGDGFGVYTPFGSNQDEAGQVAFAFCNGEVWGINAYLLGAMVDDQGKIIPDVEKYLENDLSIFTKFLVSLGISPPFSWEAGMEDTMGRALYSKEWSPFRARSLCMQPSIIATGTHSPENIPRQSLRPFFESLFDACGAEWVE